MTRPATHDDYLAALPADQRAALSALRRRIRALLPEAEEVISYAMPAFRQKQVVVGFAAFKHHLGLYPFSGSVIPRLGTETTGFRTSKSGVLFTPDRPLPDRLLRRIIENRLAEIG